MKKPRSLLPIDIDDEHYFKKWMDEHIRKFRKSMHFMCGCNIKHIKDDTKGGDEKMQVYEVCFMSEELKDYHIEVTLATSGDQAKTRAMLQLTAVEARQELLAADDLKVKVRPFA